MVSSSLFFRYKRVFLLLNIYNSVVPVYSSRLAKVTDVNYSHVVRLIVKFEREGLVTRRKEGRIQVIVLTPKGRELADLFSRCLMLVR